MTAINYAYAPTTRWVHKQTEEEVAIERWIWTVLYEGGQELVQFDQTGEFHQFQEIDVDRVKRFSMICVGDTRKQISLAVEDNMQIFHFYRNTVLHANTPEEVRLKTYGFGYKNKVTGDAMYHYILPDDRLIITTDKDFNPIKQTT